MAQEAPLSGVCVPPHPQRSGRAPFQGLVGARQAGRSFRRHCCLQGTGWGLRALPRESRPANACLVSRSGDAIFPPLSVERRWSLRCCLEGDSSASRAAACSPLICFSPPALTTFPPSRLPFLKSSQVGFLDYSLGAC